tara:strand:- start:382 stop:1281 length:900 start_codon:yes stop_codon:yes gene_type:complete
MKPFIKWVGGKSQIMKHIVHKIPRNIKDYHEPFVGGGSVLLKVLSLQKNGEIEISGKVYAYDLNNSLINMYKNIQKTPLDVLYHLDELFSTYDSCKGSDVNRKPPKEESQKSKENFYYWSRNEFNTMDKKIKLSSRGSALFIFLNKTCFRGMFREGPNGFNVPYGHYKKTPSYLDKESILKLSKYVKNVVFKCRDFSDSLVNTSSGDFVYLDPPYVPIKTTSFVGYTDKGFTRENHEELFRLIHQLRDKKIHMMMSNSNSIVVKKAFADFSYQEIGCRRTINSKNPGMRTTELLIEYAP